MGSSLRADWIVVPIEEVLVPLDNGRVLHHGWSPRCEKEPSPDSDQWGVLKTTAVQDGLFLPEHNKRLPERLKPRPQLEVKEGDILLTCAGPRQRCGVPCLVRRTRPRLILSGKMYRFRVLPDLMSAEYLEAFLRSRDAQLAIDKMKTGISDSGLNLTHGRFLRLSIRVAPLVEQRAIVAKIEALFSELDKGVEQLEQVAEQLKRYRQAVLKAAFEGKLTADWRAQQHAASTLPSAEDLLEQIQAERAARYEQQLADWKQAVKDWEAAGGKSSGQKKPRKPTIAREVRPPSLDETGGLPDIPAEWQWVSVELLAQPERPITYGVIKLGKEQSGGVPILRSSNVRHLHLELDHVKRISPSIADNFARTYLDGGEVLITVRGTLGGIAVAPTTCRGFNVSREVAPIALLHCAEPSYVQYAIGSWYIEQWLEPRLRGIAYTGINIETLKRLPIPLVSRSEQEQIVDQIEARFSVLDQLAKAVNDGLQQAETLRRSILKKAFEGRLLSETELAAVKADPAYEPAEVLLERIRAERGQTGAGTKRSRRGGKATTARLPKVSGPERYKQAAYAAYAVQRLAGRETFGRVQQMKLVYLIPHALTQESKVYARREAAGPLDPAIHKIEGLAKKNGWFTTRKVGQRYRYTPGAKIDEAVKFAKDRFGDKADRVDWLLGQFAKMDTERAELVATTFAVWNDHLIDGQEPSEDQIVAGVHGWHPEKVTKFPPDRIAKCIQWMKNNSFVPTGIGPKTTEGMAAE